MTEKFYYKEKRIDTDIFIGEKNKNITKYNLPPKVEFCKKCLNSNQKPTTRAEHLIKEDVKVNGEYYVGTSINYLINKGLRVKIFEVDNWISFGDPTELNLYYFWQDYMRDIN